MVLVQQHDVMQQCAMVCHAHIMHPHPDPLMSDRTSFECFSTGLKEASLLWQYTCSTGFMTVSVITQCCTSCAPLFVVHSCTSCAHLFVVHSCTSCTHLFVTHSCTSSARLLVMHSCTSARPQHALHFQRSQMSFTGPQN